MNEKLLELYKSGNIDEMLDSMDTMSPNKIEEFISSLFEWLTRKTEKNLIDYLHNSMNERQYQRFRYLNSSERSKSILWIKFKSKEIIHLMTKIGLT